MKFKQRIISLLLAILTVFTLLPIEAFAGSTVWFVGASSGQGGGGGGGNWGYAKQGYRISIVDGKTGETVARKVDFVFGKIPSAGALYVNNKTESARAVTYEEDITTGEGMLILDVGVIDNRWPRWIISSMSGGQYTDENRESNGAAFNMWFMAGKATLGSGGTGSKPPNSYTGGGSVGSSNGVVDKKPSTKPKPGSGTGSGTGTGNSVGGNTGSSTSVRAEKDNQIRNSMRAEYDKWIKAGKSNTYAADKAVAEGNRILQGLRNSFAYETDDLQHWADVVRTYGAKLHAPDSAMGSMSIPKYSPTYEKLSDGSLLFDIGYAADNGSHLTDKGKAYKVMNLEYNGEFAFKFTNGVIMSKDTDPNTGELVESVIATICDNDFRILVEPLIWFTPEKYDGGRCDAFGEAFYGTPTNYGQFIDYVTSRGAWSDGNAKYKGKYTQKDRTGIGGNYNFVCNFFGAYSLHLNEDLVFSSNPGKTVKAVQGKTSATSSNCVRSIALGSNTDGYALFYYYGDPGGWVPPRTQTYDPFEKDPNPDPHKAPNPDPYYKTPSGKTPVPLTEGEPAHPKEVPPSTDKGYKQITRTINIVKVYDIEHIDGTIEHVKTEARRWNPGTIAVNQEPDYKVIGYYTSPYYIGWELFQPWQIIFYPGPNSFPELNIEYTSDYYMPLQAHLTSNEDIGDWDDTEESKASWVRPEISTEWKDMREWVESISTEFGATKKFDFDNKIEYDEDAEAGKVVGTVQIGVVADLEYSPDSGEIPKEGYDDTTLYVHLIKKEKIPETSTWDEPKYPPAGNPPVVPPNAPPNPFDPPITDLETDPPSETYSHYRIVKVYETEDETTGQIDTDAILHRFPTNPIVHIEDEAQKGKPDFSYHLIEWLYGDEYNGVKWNDKDERPNGEDWDGVISGVNPKGAGTTEAKVDLIDKENVEETVTLYVRLRRKTGSRVPGEIIIEQSQISKVIHSNDKNIGGRFGDYRFAMTVGDFKISHIAYYNHCCVGGDHRYHSCRCLGHTCYHEMPGRAGDNKLNFNFDLISSQHDLEIPKGVFSKTDPKVYGKGGSSFDAITSGVDYPKTISSLYASDNKWYFTSDGNDSNGAEYVPILWRCSSGGLNDIPTLAKFKQNDITKRYGAENYTIPDKMLSSVGSTANKISNKKRASAPMAFPYEFTFGLHSRSDITATSSCVTHNGYNCIDTDTQDYYPIEGTEFTYDFKAGVAIQFYAGTAKGLQAAPFGGKATQPQLEKVIGKHTENNIIQCKQEIKFYPYIRMTYMVNSLEDAIKEEENTYETGYNQDVRKDTYVLSEWESSVLPSDAVTVSWKNKNEDESLLITSQQWSVHQKAVNGSEVWNGKNQVLPGGAIYQLSTPKDNWTTVNITTYQTVVDQKARQEYLSSNLSGDEYTEGKVAQDHLDFINDAKEVLDNLKLVQWVNKNPGASKAWTQDFVAKPSQGIVKILDGTSITTVDLSGLRGGSKTNPNDDQKYYMRQQTQLSDYQQVTKLSEWTKTIDDAQSIKEQPYEGDMDVFNMKHETTVYKLFMNTSGDIYLASITKKYGTNDTGMDNTQSDIENMVKSMKDLNADTYAMGQTGGAKVEKLCNKKVSGSMINSILKDDAKEIDDATSFITNFVSALTRNKGSDYTAEWASDLTDGKWYNEAFDGVYLVKQSTTFNIGLAFSSSRVSALDPALCPQNKGQSDLYTSAFLSQFCLDSQSDATIAQGKVKNFIGTFKGVDITMPDMESMYVSKKFWIPNANVQDLN